MAKQQHAGETSLDDIDFMILRELQTDSSVSNVELARRVNLSPPATHTRVKRLESMQVIRGYVAVLDRERLGYDLLCFISVRLELHNPQTTMDFQSHIRTMPEVLECHQMAGDYDYVLKVATRNRQHLQQFLMDTLTPVGGVAQIHTRIVLEEVKSTTVLPLPRESEA